MRSTAEAKLARTSSQGSLSRCSPIKRSGSRGAGLSSSFAPAERSSSRGSSFHVPDVAQQLLDGGHLGNHRPSEPPPSSCCSTAGVKGSPQLFSSPVTQTHAAPHRRGGTRQSPPLMVLCLQAARRTRLTASDEEVEAKASAAAFSLRHAGFTDAASVLSASAEALLMLVTASADGQQAVPADLLAALLSRVRQSAGLPDPDDAAGAFGSRGSGLAPARGCAAVAEAAYWTPPHQNASSSDVADDDRDPPGLWMPSECGGGPAEHRFGRGSASQQDLSFSAASSSAARGSQREAVLAHTRSMPLPLPLWRRQPSVPQLRHQHSSGSGQPRLAQPRSSPAGLPQRCKTGSSGRLGSFAGGRKFASASSLSLPCSARLSDAFPTADVGLEFARQAVARLSDVSCSENGDETEDSLSPMRLREESPRAFARRMLVVCRKVAVQTREEGGCLFQSDSSSASPSKSNSPSKRSNCASSCHSSMSPTKRLRPWVSAIGTGAGTGILAAAARGTPRVQSTWALDGASSLHGGGSPPAAAF